MARASVSYDAYFSSIFPLLDTRQISFLVQRQSAEYGENEKFSNVSDDRGTRLELFLPPQDIVYVHESGGTHT